MTTIYDFEAQTLDGRRVKLDTYKGKVLLIVNTASECGFTPQYKGLEALWRKYQPQGLIILGFPCNQFGHQEPGENTQIGAFCSKNFGVTFPLFSKIDVNGDNAHPLYQYLKAQAPGIVGSQAIKWNFTKFLVDRSGKVVKRFASVQTPEKIDAQIAALL
ncbi:glutathione peroxidase [Sinimarinibacterium sp. NLF-5-8]|uniref:glutathione peroxidase n=1 Tax=Sinimarinibacterium sp. NLF-5-8 TaxID=2698684 RepID=UPI00137BEA04|nr:glutathione peroxidase [Sinimarinibacterium sp. NLF-5-8]QHS09860.1 glutathione peroxidase [Sinimarinibacterium sp. NLF-5-8]